MTSVTLIPVPDTTPCHNAIAPLVADIATLQLAAKEITVVDDQSYTRCKEIRDICMERIAAIT